MTVNELKKFATDVRIETVKCLETRTFGHIGGCLSIADVLTVLYNDELKNIDPSNPQKEDRDMLVVSKGHAGPAVFATLALKGYFPLDWLATLCEGGTRLPSHCDRLRTPGIDASTGSLGQGLSIANGFAHAAKIQGKENRVYCLMGDGEIQEGQIWEAAMYAHQYKLNNLVGIVDWNKKQIDGTTDECISLLDIAEKFRTFGWYAVTVKGDDIEAIQNAFKQIRENQSDKPGVLVLDGVKGSGVKCIEKMKFNHMIPVEKDLADQCLVELEAVKKSL
jgi:putative carbohydrate degradation enzyme